MNLVFQALVILVFLMPGLIFRLRYNRGDWGWNYPIGKMGNVTEQIPKAIVHAAWLNLVWGLLISGLHRAGLPFFRAIDLGSAVAWLSNNYGKDQVGYDRAVRSLTKHPESVCLYFLGLFFFSYLSGWVFYALVRWRQWDINNTFGCRFENDWHYLFSGEVLSFPDKYKRIRSGMNRPEISRDDYGATAVSAIVDVKDKAYLYLGIIVDFFFDANGNLDRILLVGAKRRALSEDRGAQLVAPAMADSPSAGYTQVEQVSSTRIDSAQPGTSTIETRTLETIVRSSSKERLSAVAAQPTTVAPTPSATRPLPSPTASARSSFLDIDRFYPISGHFFVLKFAETRSLNIDYLSKYDLDEYRRLQQELIQKTGLLHELIETPRGIDG